MRFTQIKETVIYIDDTQRAVDFYHEQLGLPLIGHKPGEHVFFRAGSSMLLCFVPEHSAKKTTPPPHMAYGPAHFAFEVPKEDYEGAKERIKALGLAIEDEITWPTGALSFYFRDPFNHSLEIAMPGIWGD